MSIQFIERNFGEVESEIPGASHLGKTGLKKNIFFVADCRRFRA